MFVFAKTFGDGTAESAFRYDFTALDTAAATTAQYGIHVRNMASSEGMDAAVVIENLDTDDPVGAAVRIINAGGNFTNILDIEGTLISKAELILLNGKDATLVDGNDAAGGDMTGPFGNLQIASGAVGAVEVGNDALDFADLEDALDLDANTTIDAAAGFHLTISKTLSSGVADTGLITSFIASDPVDDTDNQFGLYIDNQPSTEGLNATLVIDNSDTDDPVDAAIKIINAGGGFTSILDIEGTMISGYELTRLVGKDATLMDANDTWGNTALKVEDTDASHTINLKWNEDDTANRTLNVKVNGADRTIDLSGNLTVTGAVNISGTNTGDQTTVSGNAGTATALQTARAIYGNNFDGTAALTQVIASTYGGTGNGFTKFTGPATAERTKTLRNADDTILELGGSYTPTGTWTNMVLVTPALGTPSALVATNATGTASGLTAGTVTTNANLTGHITSTGNAAVLGSFTIAQLNTAISDADAAYLAGGQTFTGGLTINGGLTLGTALAVAQGGSGATTLTGILKGNGTGAFTAVTAPSGALVGDTDAQSLTNKKLGSLTTNGFVKTSGSDGTLSVSTAIVSADITDATIVGADVSAALKAGAITWGYTGTPTTGLFGNYITMHYAGTITGWSISAAGTNPTCTFDVWKISTGTALPTVANTIMGTKPALTTGNAVRSTTLTSWTTSFIAGDIFACNLDAISNGSNVTFTIETSK